MNPDSSGISIGFKPLPISVRLVPGRLSVSSLIYKVYHFYPLNNLSSSCFLNNGLLRTVDYGCKTGLISLLLRLTSFAVNGRSPL
jgi:hypothetical protein